MSTRKIFYNNSIISLYLFIGIFFSVGGIIGKFKEGMSLGVIISVVLGLGSLYYWQRLRNNPAFVVNDEGFSSNQTETYYLFKNITLLYFKAHKNHQFLIFKYLQEEVRINVNLLGAKEIEEFKSLLRYGELSIDNEEIKENIIPNENEKITLISDETICGEKSFLSESHILGAYVKYLKNQNNILIKVILVVLTPIIVFIEIILFLLFHASYM